MKRAMTERWRASVLPEAEGGHLSAHARNKLHPVKRRVLRLLQRGLYDDHVPISDEQCVAVHRRVLERFNREPGANLLRLLPGSLAVMTIPLWPSLRSRFGLLVDAIAEVLFVMLALGLIWWMFRRAYFRHGRRVIREQGFADICPSCGYDLSHRQREGNRCPECGDRVAART